MHIATKVVWCTRLFVYFNGMTASFLRKLWFHSLTQQHGMTAIMLNIELNTHNTN